MALMLHCACSVLINMPTHWETKFRTQSYDLNRVDRIYEHDRGNKHGIKCVDRYSD